MKKFILSLFYLLVLISPLFSFENNPKSITSILNQSTIKTPFTLMVKNKQGKTLEFNHKNSTPNTLYRSASTSKWITATIILELVQKGKLSLSDHPQKYLKFWQKRGKLSKITLKELLNFTSGLSNKPFCLNFKRANFEKCVKRISQKNSSPSGISFSYGPNHLQVAGLMAVKASNFSSWQTLFKDFKKRHQLFQNSSYDLPSKTNPRLAGGMHWNASDYLNFLEALYHHKILKPHYLDLMTHDQLGKAIIENSPAKRGMKEDWHYGFGVWIECHSKQFNCQKRSRVSCPGAYGAYPFIDFEHGYYGIVALEGRYRQFTRGYEILKKLSPTLNRWTK